MDGSAHANKTRLQIDLSPEQIGLMDRMQDACGIATRKELFNNALSLFDWAITEVQKGRVIASLDESTERYVALHMPTLAHASRRGAGIGHRQKIERANP